MEDQTQRRESSNCGATHVLQKAFMVNQEGSGLSLGFIKDGRVISQIEMGTMRAWR
jgi:hypothetical protein